MKLLRSWVQSCCARLFLKFFFLIYFFFKTAFPLHALIHSYRTCGSRGGTHRWAGRRGASTEGNQYAHWVWSFLSSVGLVEGAKSLSFLPEFMGVENVQQRLWSLWDLLLSTQWPGHVPQRCSPCIGKVVHYLGEGINTLFFNHHSLSERWTQWKTLKRHEKEAS